ncbi:MAG: hypothetical protein WEC33_05230 [Dehalococcoidia bacterium]
MDKSIEREKVTVLNQVYTNLSVLCRLTSVPLYLPGEAEPASLGRNAEHARILAEIRRDERAARRARRAIQGPSLVVRLRRAVGLA